MDRVVRSPRAVIDLADIVEYIAVHNVTAARRLLERFDDLFDQLAQNPQMGQRREELARGARTMSVGNYVVVFRPISDGVEVIRVVHGARDIDALFAD
jgi:toxin ParE1/3/4